MRCKVLGCRVDRIQGNSVTREDIFSKMLQGCDETRWFTDSGVDAF